MSGPSVSTGGPQVTKGSASLQVAGTPPELYNPVSDYWGFGRDIAASAENAKCHKYWTEEDDALGLPWHLYCTLDLPGWCNHPYANCGIWTRKAHEEALLGATVVMLQPAALHRNYYRDYVKKGPCAVILLNRPVKFIGYELASPTVHALYVWNKGLPGGVWGEADYLDVMELHRLFDDIKGLCV